MDVRKLLNHIALFLRQTRQVGHTTAICAAAKERPGAFVVAGDHNSATWIKKEFGVDAVSMLEPEPFCSMKGPLLIDNYALLQLCLGATAEIEEADRARLEEIRKHGDTRQATRKLFEEEMNYSARCETEAANEGDWALAERHKYRQSVLRDLSRRHEELLRINS